MPRKPIAIAWLDAHGRQLHADGMIDREIAKRCVPPCVPSVVCYWRKKRGLPANAPLGSEDWKASRGKILAKTAQTLALLEMGLTDKEAAAMLGISRKAFESRRARHLKLGPGRYEVKR